MCSSMSPSPLFQSQFTLMSTSASDSFEGKDLQVAGLLHSAFLVHKVATVSIHAVASKNFQHFVNKFSLFNYVRCNNVHGPSLCLLLDTAVTMLGIQGEIMIQYLCLQMCWVQIELTNPLYTRHIKNCGHVLCDNDASDDLVRANNCYVSRQQDHWSGTVRKYLDMAFLNLFLYCIGDMTVGDSFLGPPRMPEAFTHVSSCLSQVYWRK